MKFSKCEIDGIIIVELSEFTDHRGFFMETYKKSLFAQNGLPEEFVQDNHSYSKKGVLRGMHYQLKTHPMGKLVRATRGEIFDVGIDLRLKSKISLMETRGAFIATRYASKFLSCSAPAPLPFPPTRAPAVVPANTPRAFA